MDYKEKLEGLRRAGFTAQEIQRLYLFRQAYVTNEKDQAPADLSRLQFIRWLVEHGRMSDQCARSSAFDRKENEDVSTNTGFA